MRRKTVRVLWTLFAISCFAVLGLGFAIDRGWIGYMPDLEDLEDPIDRYASQLISADGKPLGSWSQNENRVFVPYDSISPHVFRALVATEDVRFYEHTGVDVQALGRAVVKRGLLGQKSAGGGSTITQQLAKQLYSKAAHSTLERLLQKPIEWVIALELERHYTKEEILTLYLNYFDFLHNAVGIKSASQVYFNKKPIDLTVGESAMLVGMLKNPAFYNPVRQPERTRERRNVVLEQMERAGFLGGADADATRATELGLDFHRMDHKVGPTPYLREYLRRIMMAEEPRRERYGEGLRQQFYEDSLAWATNPLYGWCKKNTKHNGKCYNLYTDGLKVYTTVDSRMQKYAEDAVASHVVRQLQPIFNRQRGMTSTFPYVGISTAKADALLWRAVRQTPRYSAMKAEGCSDEEIRRAFNTKTEMTIFTYRGERDTLMSPLDSIRHYKSFLRSSLVSIDPLTGYVKAYVGGLDFTHFQYDMALTGRRQVGSTMKPFVYSMAMEDGLTPDYRVRNVMRSYGGWMPKNGSRAAYGAMMPLRWGLAQSNNWITAGIMSEVDPSGKRLVKMLRELGVANANIPPSMALCLGACEVTACELASAYSIFVNGGIHSAPIFVTRIEDNQGNVVAEFLPRQNEVISQRSSSEMIDMLRGVVRSGTARRLAGLLGGSGDMAAKTGTTNNNADAWFVGLVPRLVTSCWVGGEDRDIHFISTSIGQGAAAALPIWASYMKKVYADKALGYSLQEKFEEYEDSDDDVHIYNSYGDDPGRYQRGGDADDEGDDDGGNSAPRSAPSATEPKDENGFSTPEDRLFE